MAFKGYSNVEKCKRATVADLSREPPQGERYCHASVLHLTLKDFMAAIKEDDVLASEFTPFLTLGTLLGAFRNNSILPWSHDIDIAFFMHHLSTRVLARLTRRLEDKGYILFKSGIWRVCLSFKHPLATKLMEQSGNFSGARREWKGDIPYLDMYGVVQEGGSFVHQTLGHRFPLEGFLPLGSIHLLGDQYPVMRQPEMLFKAAGYGDFWHDMVENH